MRQVVSPRARSLPLFQALESRLLFAATLVSNVPDQVTTAGLAPTTVDLNSFFDNPAGTVVQFATPLGNVLVELTDSVTPQTVANFLNYLNSGEYANTIIHRVASAFVVQGGGYTPDGNHITQNAPVPGENANSTLHNTIGTISMALSNGPDSGTSEWFINLANNNGSGSTPDLDNSSDGGPFTPFGSVIGNGMTVVNEIAALQQVNDTGQGSGAWSNLPVLSTYTGAATATSVPQSDLVTNATTVFTPLESYDTSLTYSASSSDTNTLTASVSDGTLSLAPAAGVTSGSAKVTVSAVDAYGDTVQSTFTVNVNSLTQAVTIGAGANKSVTYTDADGTVGVLTYKGAGTATVNFQSDTGLSVNTAKGAATIVGSGASITGISTTGGGANSTLTITAKGGTKAFSVGAISTQSLKSITGKGITLGDLTATGVIGTINVAGATGGVVSAVSIGSATFTGNFADNVALTGSGLDIKSFKAGAITGGNWQVSGSIDKLSASTISGWQANTGAIGMLQTKGDFFGNLDALSIKSASINGGLTSSTLTLNGSADVLGKLAVKGTIAGSTVSGENGSFGSISAAALTDSFIDAGVAEITPGIVTGLNGQAIGSVKIKGAVSGSQVAASNLGKMTFGTLDTVNGGTIAAQSIASLTAVANKKFHLKNVTAANESAELTAAGVTLGAFVLQLL